MGKENEERQTPAIEGPYSSAHAPKPKETPVAEVKETPVVKADAKPAPEVKETPATGEGDKGGSKHVRIDVEDEIPDNASLLEMSSKTLQKRLQRHTAKELKDRFGTSDVGEIKKKLDRLEELEKGEAERQRASMSEKEKLEADLKKERQLRADAEHNARRVHENHVVEKEETRITRLAEKHNIDTDPDTLEIVFKRLAKHLKSEYSEEQLKKLSDKDLDAWFTEYGTKHPRHLKDAPAAGETKGKAEAKPEIKKVPLDNGVKGSKPDPAKGPTANQVNFSPKGANAMSRGEARDAAKKEGYSW
jgi:hypothetical protein